jgi:hypothetical protein
VRTAVAASAPLILAAPLVRISRASAAALPKGSLVASTAELAQLRRNIFDLKLLPSRRAWQNTLARANDALGYQPSPPKPDIDFSDWNNVLYRPGLHDGVAAIDMALAYAISGNPDHARQSRVICLGWARTYNPLPSAERIPHMVAEPAGPAIKLFMAYELTKLTYSAAERKEFVAWAGQFVQRGMSNADSALDDPWVEAVVYGKDRTDVAAYGNSATWQRLMAVWASALVGGTTFASTLGWNFSHRTPGGREYGWDELLEGLVIDGAGGQVAEDRYRKSVHYGNFSWGALVHLADLARRARFRVDLFRYRSRAHRYTIFTPIAYYGPMSMRPSITDTLESTPQYAGSEWPKEAARQRAMYEVLYRNATDPATVKLLRRTVNHGGPTQRGDNYDVYTTGNTALLGRGPRGPVAK